MSYLQEQIAVEKQRITVYEAKIEKCKKRIESLEFLMQDSDDELDILAANTATVKPMIPSQSSNEVNVMTGNRRRAIGGNQLALLRFIGTEGKTLKDMVAFSNENNFGMDDQNLRNFAMIYRRRYKLLENPHPGFYRLTIAGQDAIK